MAYLFCHIKSRGADQQPFQFLIVNFGWAKKISKKFEKIYEDAASKANKKIGIGYSMTPLYCKNILAVATQEPGDSDALHSSGNQLHSLQSGAHGS